MVNELCAEVRNYFTQNADKHAGKYVINGGHFAPLPFLRPGQYFRVIGSTFNDGVHLWPAEGLKDEEFVGAVWAMKVPPDFVRLSEEIDKYSEDDTETRSAFVSESFGGWSGTKGTDANGKPLTWRDVFADKLEPYRRLFV